jgi:hypothetical protein
MSAKTKLQNVKRKKTKTGSRAASTISIAARNLINMAAVFAVSGTVLLGLLAAKRF